MSSIHQRTSRFFSGENFQDDDSDFTACFSMGEIRKAQPRPAGMVVPSQSFDISIWQEVVSTFAKEVLIRGHIKLGIESLELAVANLKREIEHLRSPSILVPIQTFSPEKIEIIKPFSVVVQYNDNDYIASFFDANISASGDTQEEAVSNLKDMIVSLWDILRSEPEENLGPTPKQQLNALRTFIASS